MPSTARQLRQPPTIEAIGRVPYFADVGYRIAIVIIKLLNRQEIDKAFISSLYTKLLYKPSIPLKA